MKVIQATYKWTIDEMVTAQLHHTQHNGKQRRRLRFVMLTGMMLVVTLIVWRYFLLDWRLLILLGMAYIGVISAEVTRHPRYVEWSARRMFSRFSDQNKMVTFTLDRRGIQRGETLTEWDEIDKVLETGDGFLLYLNKDMFLWIPKGAFRPKAALAQFRQLLAEKQISYHS